MIEANLNQQDTKKEHIFGEIGCSLGTPGHGVVSLPVNCAFKVGIGLASAICKILRGAASVA